MCSIKKNVKTIPIDKINGIDAMFDRQMKLDSRNIPGKFKPFYEKTRKDSFNALTIKGIFESYKVEEIAGDLIRLSNGVVLESSMLARVLHKSTELVFYVAGVHGYEALDEAEENMMAKLFLDSWGTAIIECGSSHFKKCIAKELEEKEIYSTFSFSPGQHNVPMEMQKIIFDMLKPDEIGVSLNDHYLMHPKKSVSGIFGIGPHKDEEGLQPCDFCDLRETCSSAYVGSEDFE